jgi:DNA modification methylase
VAAFIAAHGTPYDPASDTYQRDPLVVHGRHGKSSAIYNAHAYHTKVPPEAIKPYIEHYTSPGDIVLDPFCGSGMTGVACLLTGRHAVLSDLSPAAVHIAYNYCTPVDLAALKGEWERIKGEVADEFRWLYGATCDRCGGPATIQYTVWSDIFGCPRCEADIVLWDAAVVRSEVNGRLDPPLSGLTEGGSRWRPTMAGAAGMKRGRSGEPVARQAGDVLEEFGCPSCSDRLKKGDCTYRRTVPVLTTYECDGLCRPRRRERATSEAERDRIEEIAAREMPYWVPDTPFDPTREMYLRNGRIFRDQQITKVRGFWTPRNLWALASLWSRASLVEDERLARALRFLVTSTSNRSSITTRYLFGKGGNSVLGATLYVGSFTCENNLLRLAERKWQDVYHGLQEQMLFGRASAMASMSNAAALTCLGDSSIDYIFTDPPFGSNIFYADCSLLSEAWLSELTDQEQEAVWNKSRPAELGGKTLDDYRDLMERSFAEMFRVLKPGRWATVVFSNSDDRVWHAIQTAAEKAGFAMAAAGTLDKMQRSYQGVQGAKGTKTVVTKDVVMNLLKPVAGAVIRTNAEIGDPEEHVRGALHAYLAHLAQTDGAEPGARTTQALYDHVITSLLAKGVPTAGFGLAFVQSVAQESFKQVDGLWYRRGDRVRSDKPRMNIVDETSAVMWLDQRLALSPATEAEIIPEFNTASTSVHIAGGLSRLLRENFSFDPIRRSWRLPTAPEREALNDAGREQRRRRVLSIAREGIADLTAAELLELVRDAVELELYREAHEMLGRVHSPDLTAEQAEVAGLMRAVIGAHLED